MRHELVLKKLCGLLTLALYDEVTNISSFHRDNERFAFILKQFNYSFFGHFFLFQSPRFLLCPFCNCYEGFFPRHLVMHHSLQLSFRKKPEWVHLERIWLDSIRKPPHYSYAHFSRIHICMFATKNIYSNNF